MQLQIYKVSLSKVASLIILVFQNEGAFNGVFYKLNVLQVFYVFYVKLCVLKLQTQLLVKKYL